MAEVAAGNARNFLEGVAADRGIEAAVIAVENASESLGRKGPHLPVVSSSKLSGAREEIVEDVADRR